MDLGAIVLLGIISFAVLAVITNRVYYFFFKKGESTPEDLEGYFFSFVRLMNVAPYAVIFQKESNNGQQIIYKEYTKKRNVYLIIERGKLSIIQKDNDGIIIFNSEVTDNIWAGLEDLEWIERIHELYVNRLP